MAHSLSLVRECDVVRNGALRISTPFSYPNGDFIDVFLQVEKNLFRSLSLSDYGYTSMYLRSAQIEIGATAKKRNVIGSILSQLGVKMVGGDLVVEVEPANPNDISDAIFRLSQACLRISDFASHQQPRIANPFRDEVAVFLRKIPGLTATPNPKVPGRFSNDVRVDFETASQRQLSYICVLASLSESAAHTTANETFRKWYDIAGGRMSERPRITIYDSKSPYLKASDKKRLQDYSSVVAYPSEDNELQKLIAA